MRKSQLIKHQPFNKQYHFDIHNDYEYFFDLLNISY